MNTTWAVHDGKPTAIVCFGLAGTLVARFVVWPLVAYRRRQREAERRILENQRKARQRVRLIEDAEPLAGPSRDLVPEQGLQRPDH